MKTGKKSAQILTIFSHMSFKQKITSDFYHIFNNLIQHSYIFTSNK